MTNFEGSANPHYEVVVSGNFRTPDQVARMIEVADELNGPTGMTYTVIDGDESPTGATLDGHVWVCVEALKGSGSAIEFDNYFNHANQAKLGWPKFIGRSALAPTH